VFIINTKAMIGYFIVAMRMAELSSEQIQEVDRMLALSMKNTTEEQALAVYESLQSK
jgi:hypothetical protein